MPEMLWQYWPLSMGALPTPVHFCEVRMHRSASFGRRLLAAAPTAALGMTVAGVADTHAVVPAYACTVSRPHMEEPT